MVFESVQVLVPFPTLEKRANIGLVLGVVVAAQSRGGAMAMKVVVLESVGILVRLVAAEDSASVRLVSRAVGIGFGHVFDHAKHFVSLTDQIHR